MNFKSELLAFLARFEPYAQNYFREKVKAVSKYSPLIVRFYRDLADFSSGGKRMRAYLVWLGYRVATGNKQLATSKVVTDILPVSLAYEIVHSFLLIHDDIIDRSDIRRGKLTVHKRYEKLFDEHYGVSQAIVIGDIACFEAFDLVNSSGFDNDLKTFIIKKLIGVLLETAYGEALDVQYSYQKATLSQIWQVADFKSARYSFVGPLVLGAMLGRARDKQVEALTQFGLSAGIAFQLRDDVLGVFGNEKVLGKSVLSDLQEGKNTLLVYKARELSLKKDKMDLKRIWGKRDATFADLKSIQEIIKRSGGLAWGQREQMRLVKKAKESIKDISSDQNLQKIFDQIADFVINREK